MGLVSSRVDANNAALDTAAFDGVFLLGLAQHLPLSRVVLLRLVCRAWRDVMSTPLVGSMLLERDFSALMGWMRGADGPLPGAILSLPPWSLLRTLYNRKAILVSYTLSDQAPVLVFGKDASALPPVAMRKGVPIMLTAHVLLLSDEVAVSVRGYGCLMTRIGERGVQASIAHEVDCGEAPIPRIIQATPTFAWTPVCSSIDMFPEVKP
jgi:hypothetical protein